jgi:hypothetical protein
MIYSITDVKRACSHILEKSFPNIKVYGNDTLDGYTRPSFFVELLSHGRHKPGRYITQIGFTYRITYFEKCHNEAHCLEVYETICKAFEPVLRVNDSKLVVKDMEYNWIDENADKLQITVSFYDVTYLSGTKEEQELMEELNINYESEGMY